VDEEAPNFRRWTRASKAKAGAFAALLVIAPTSAWAVMFRMPGDSFAGELAPLSMAEAATRDALRADLVALAEGIGERNVGRPAALEEAAAYVERGLRAVGYEPSRQPVDADGVACANIDAERRGTSDEIVLVGAHYDSALGTPGANDNASGVAVLLAVARGLSWQSVPTRRTLRLVAFVNEEPPYFRTPRMGSAVYASRSAARGEHIVAMLSLETLGYYSDAPGSQAYPFPMDLAYPDRGNFVAFIGDVGSRELVRAAVDAFRSSTAFPSEGAALPAKTIGVGWSDHEPFWNAGYPAIMVTDTALFRYRAYHTRNDTLDQIDVDRLARVTGGITRVIEALLK